MQLCCENRLLLATNFKILRLSFETYIRMKNINLLFIFFAIVLVSCKGNDPNPPYVYESNPYYSYGLAEFYGSYYKEFGIDNNVISLSLYSDTLKRNDDGDWYGQYLYLEDVFVAPNDTLLPLGTYTISDSNEPFTIAPGVLDTIDNEVYTLGAAISYYERNSSKSVMKLITEGTISVSKVGLKYYILCDLKTDDKMELKGTFLNELLQTNESLQTDGTPIHKSRSAKKGMPFRKL